MGGTGTRARARASTACLSVSRSVGRSGASLSPPKRDGKKEEGRKRKRKSVQHLRFPSGHPPQYSEGLTGLNFGKRNGNRCFPGSMTVHIVQGVLLGFQTHFFAMLSARPGPRRGRGRGRKDGDRDRRPRPRPRRRRRRAGRLLAAGCWLLPAAGVGRVPLPSPQGETHARRELI